jgi:hypothetical protein
MLADDHALEDASGRDPCRKSWRGGCQRRGHVEQRLAALDLLGTVSRNNEEPCRLSRFGTAKDRSRDVVLLPFAVSCLGSS